MNALNLDKAFQRITEHWRPKTVARLNGQEVKLVKFKGEFLWHHHDREDELFFCWRGKFRIEFRDRTVELQEGDFFVVPRGMEHRTVADEEVEVMLFEPADTRNTGTIVDDRFTAPPAELEPDSI